MDEQEIEDIREFFASIQDEVDEAAGKKCFCATYDSECKGPVHYKVVVVDEGSKDFYVCGRCIEAYKDANRRSMTRHNQKTFRIRKIK